MKSVPRSKPRLSMPHGITPRPGVEVRIIRDVEGVRLPTSRIRRLLSQVIESEAGRGTVQVVVVNDATTRRLNRSFRGRDKSTDVLSFPMDDVMPGPEPEQLIGEIYCNYQHCVRWASDNGGTAGDELLRLAVHGCLHLFGFDHHTSRDQIRMANAENRYLDAEGLIRARAMTIRGRDD